MGDNFNLLNDTEKMAVLYKVRKNLAEQIDNDDQAGRGSWAKKNKKQYEENAKEEIAGKPKTVQELVKEMHREKYLSKERGRS